MLILASYKSLVVLLVSNIWKAVTENVLSSHLDFSFPRSFSLWEGSPRDNGKLGTLRVLKQMNLVSVAKLRLHKVLIRGLDCRDVFICL